MVAQCNYGYNDLNNKSARELTEDWLHTLAKERGKPIMPKPMLHPTQQTQTDSVLSLTFNAAAKQEMSEETKMKIDRLLRKPRSKKYMDIICSLDVGGHVHNRKQTENIMNAIRAEFPEVEISGVLLGVVSKCYLGDDYEVHSLDYAGGIIEHFRQGQQMSGGMEKARSIVIRGGYEFIEVYVDCCRAVSSNGAVSIIR